MRRILLGLIFLAATFASYPHYQQQTTQSSSCGCQYTPPPSTPITSSVAPGTSVRRRKVLRFWRAKRSLSEPIIERTADTLSKDNETGNIRREHCSSRVLRKTLEQVLQSNYFNHTSTVTDLTLSLFHLGIYHPGVVCGPAPILFSMDSRDYCKKYDPLSKWECYLFMLN